MRPVLAAAALLLMAGTVHAGKAPPLAAELVQQIDEQGADGVQRSSRYRERFFRADEQIWVERELPEWAGQQAPADEHELNLFTATRWIRADGARAQLSLVDPFRTVLYSVAPSEYARVAFSGSWATEFSLIDPASLARLEPLQRPAQGPARWYGRESAGEYERVLWDEARLFPLKIDSGRKDGRRRAETKAAFKPLPKQWPWQKLERYTHRELADLGD